MHRSKFGSPMSPLGHSRHFLRVRRMSAYPLTAASEQTFRYRSFGPANGLRKRMHDPVAETGAWVKQMDK